MESELRLKKLRWQCRRGMREMDLLLDRWLDQHFATSSDPTLLAFEQLLGTEDDLLWDCLMGKARLSDSLQQQLIEQISAGFSASQPDSSAESPAKSPAKSQAESSAKSHQSSPT